MGEKQIVVSGTEAEVQLLAFFHRRPRSDFLRITRAAGLIGRKLRGKEVWLIGNYQMHDETLAILVVLDNLGAEYKRVPLTSPVPGATLGPSKDPKKLRSRP